MVINFAGIPVYSIFLILSLLINCVVIFNFAKIQKIDKNIVLCSLTTEMIGIITGAKILNMIQIKENNSFYYAGFSSYGGVIGGIIVLVIFSKIYNVSLKKLLNIYIPLLPFMYSISKLGCFFAGCCYGIEYNGLGNVVYSSAIEAPLNIKLLPIQLIESIANLAIFIYIICIYSKNKNSVKIISDVFVLCGVSKFVLEFFRSSWNNKISSTQVISLGFIIIGIIIKLKWRKNEKK